MLASVIVEGARESFTLLSEIADRARDATPAWDAVADDVFAFQHEWWDSEYGGKTDREQRPGRDPRYMIDTGSLRRSATVRGSMRQKVEAHPSYLLVAVTSGLAVIHENRGRPVLGKPDQGQADDWAERVSDYILTGRT